MAREFRTKVINIKFTVISVVFCFKSFPCKIKFHQRIDHFMIPFSKTFVFIKLGLKFVSKRLIKLGFFEFLKQGESTFKDKVQLFSKLTQNWITGSHVEITHKDYFFILI